MSLWNVARYAAGWFSLLWTVALAALLYANLDTVRRHTPQVMRREAEAFFHFARAIKARGLESISPEGHAHLRLISALPDTAPVHRPDGWEARALEAFGQGSPEWYELTGGEEGRPIYRYMAPLRLEAGCLSCHRDENLSAGKLRGGISVSLDAGPFLAYERVEIRRLLLTGALLWVLGLAAGAVVRRQLAGRAAAAAEAAAALRDSEERFRGLFEDAPVAYHEIDGQGVIQRVNQAECELLGYSRQEVLGRPVWDFVSPEVRQQSREAVIHKLSGEQPLEVFCREYERRDGRRLILEIHEKLIRGAQGEVLGLRSTLLDVTGREQAQRALARRTQELSRSNAELEQFAYVASHDLQEPLRKIMAFGDRLRTRCGAALDEQGRDYLERMRNAAGRMQSLINALLTLSRVKTKAQPFTQVDLARTAAEVLSDLETRTEQLGARVEVEGLPTIEADPLQMAQLLQNLIGNALKFHRPEDPPRVRIYSQPLEAEPPACRIAVEDNGIGFDEKYLDRIFQVFQRLHGRGEYEGTGVGLAICRNIVERHGGAITASSAPGRGARFIVTLPLEQAAGDQKE